MIVFESANLGRTKTCDGLMCSIGFGGIEYAAEQVRDNPAVGTLLGLLFKHYTEYQKRDATTASKLNAGDFNKLSANTLAVLVNTIRIYKTTIPGLSTIVSIIDTALALPGVRFVMGIFLDHPWNAEAEIDTIGDIGGTSFAAAVDDAVNWVWGNAGTLNTVLKVMLFTETGAPEPTAVGPGASNPVGPSSSRKGAALALEPALIQKALAAFRYPANTFYFFDTALSTYRIIAPKTAAFGDYCPYALGDTPTGSYTEIAQQSTAPPATTGAVAVDETTGKRLLSGEIPWYLNWKILLGIGLGVVAIGGGYYYYTRKQSQGAVK